MLSWKGWNSPGVPIFSPLSSYVISHLQASLVGDQRVAAGRGVGGDFEEHAFAGAAVARLGGRLAGEQQPVAGSVVSVSRAMPSSLAASFSVPSSRFVGFPVQRHQAVSVQAIIVDVRRPRVRLASDRV